MVKMTKYVKLEFGPRLGEMFFKLRVPEEQLYDYQKDIIEHYTASGYRDVIFTELSEKEGRQYEFNSIMYSGEYAPVKITGVIYDMRN